MSNFLKNMMQNPGDVKKAVNNEIKPGITFDDKGKEIRISALNTDKMPGIVSKQPEFKEIAPVAPAKQKGGQKKVNQKLPKADVSEPENLDHILQQPKFRKQLANPRSGMDIVNKASDADLKEESRDNLN